MTAAERPLALAVIAVLATAIGANKVGYADRPSAGGWASSSPSLSTPFVGYAVVWPGSSMPQGGSACDPFEDVDQSFQVTSVGKTAEQADAIRDRVRAALDPKGAVTITGTRDVAVLRWRDGQAVQRDDKETPPLFYAVDRYTATTSPA